VALVVRYLLVKYKNAESLSASIKMGEIKLDGYLCDRCDHTWISRGIDTRPVVCPRCKSPYWDVPRKNGSKKTKKALDLSDKKVVSVLKQQDDLFPWKKKEVENG
jgi:DNA-directed RNA polymerase subunit RPC12/RpoP